MMLHACFFCEAKVVRGTQEPDGWKFEVGANADGSRWWIAICPAVECGTRWCLQEDDKMRAALRKSVG